ncbi:hypothetical protein OMCYN_01681 [cyanobiont of Ornithocercus magnificus]|nr:hypothetical protein OMCYN_01681 [cyanobiont of Ornithocercus magnificus]
MHPNISPASSVESSFDKNRCRKPEAKRRPMQSLLRADGVRTEMYPHEWDGSAGN